MTEALDIPAGYRAIVPGGGFIAHNGPLYACTEGGALRLAFRVEARHCNPVGHCHGGMLATLADMQLALAVLHAQAPSERRFLPTINLALDYLAPSPLGAWVHGESQLLRSTRNMLFVQGLLHADGVPVLRMSGILKQGPLMSERLPLADTGAGAGFDPFAAIRDAIK